MVSPMWVPTCCSALYRQERTWCISFGERENEKSTGIQQAGNQTWDLPITTWTLLPLSHWTHGRGAEASLFIKSRQEASADSSCFSHSHSCIHCLILNWDSRWTEFWAWDDWLYKHIVWVNTLTIHHLSLQKIIERRLRWWIVCVPTQAMCLYSQPTLHTHSDQFSTSINTWKLASVSVN